METITQFELATPWILDAEGGLVDEKADKGGITNFGISLRFLRLIKDRDGDGFRDGDLDQDGDVDGDDIRLMTKGKALEFFRTEFWDESQCGKMKFIPALCLFDARVNHRWKSSAIVFQRGLGVKADGIIGPQTIAAANRMNDLDFLSHYLSYRSELYADIVASDSTQAVNRRGWFRRLFLLQQYILHETFTLEVGAK